MKIVEALFILIAAPVVHMILAGAVLAALAWGVPWLAGWRGGKPPVR